MNEDPSLEGQLSSSSEGRSVTIGIPFFPGKALWSIWAVAAVFVVAAVLLSVYLVNRHLKYYTQPNHQRYIVRILCMVPIYSVYSLLSLIFHKYQLYFAFLRDTYEAYVLYMFFALCVEYGGGRDEFIGYISQKPPLKLAFPLWWKVHTNEKFFRVCQQGMLQYVIIKPIVALWSIILEALGLYDDGQFRMDRGYFYNTMIINICVTVALYVVVIFYQSASDLLAPYKPLLKFTCIKIVVFFCFWQSVAISLAVHFGWIPNVDGWNVGEVSVGLQNFLICFEMFIIALMHVYAFPAEIYRVQAMSTAPLMYRMDANQVGSALKAFANSLAQGDMIRDTIDAFRWGQQRPVAKKRDDLDGADIDLDDFAVFTNEEGSSDSSKASHFLMMGSATGEPPEDGDEPVKSESRSEEDGRSIGGAAIIIGGEVVPQQPNHHRHGVFKHKYRTQHGEFLLNSSEEEVDPLSELDGVDLSVLEVAAVLEDNKPTEYNYDDSQITATVARR